MALSETHSTKSKPKRCIRFRISFSLLFFARVAVPRFPCVFHPCTHHQLRINVGRSQLCWSLQFVVHQVQVIGLKRVMIGSRSLQVSVVEPSSVPITPGRSGSGRGTLDRIQPLWHWPNDPTHAFYANTIDDQTFLSHSMCLHISTSSAASKHRPSNEDRRMEISMRKQKEKKRDEFYEAASSFSDVFGVMLCCSSRAWSSPDWCTCL